MIEKVKIFLSKNPNSKAKDIAKELGCTNKEINQILHYNPEFFVQDKTDFTWTVHQVNESKIVFSGSWIDCDSFEASLSNANVELDKASSVIFILDGCSFMLDALARLLALCNQLAFDNKKVAVDFV